MMYKSESEIREISEKAKRRNELYFKLLNKRDELVDKLMKHFDDDFTIIDQEYYDILDDMRKLVADYKKDGNWYEIKKTVAYIAS